MTIDSDRQFLAAEGAVLGLPLDPVAVFVELHRSELEGQEKAERIRLLGEFIRGLTCVPGGPFEVEICFGERALDVLSELPPDEMEEIFRDLDEMIFWYGFVRLPWRIDLNGHEQS